MSKNIVICCDGTGNEFGRLNSNVVKLYQALVCDPTQVAYYHPGLGTMGARSALTQVGKWWTRVIGLAFGYGISENVADAYQFLMRTFEPEDRVFLFGFSRGAYTARALAGMLHGVGLLTRGNEALIPYAIRLLRRSMIDFGVAASFKKTFARECKPHFIGVWDTVSSVGWVYNAVHFPFTNLTHNPDSRVVRHAISIDERRAFFRQNVFGAPTGTVQDVAEVWFAGAHSDVGGGYPEPESQLSQIALQWMAGQAVGAGLQVSNERLQDLLGGKPGHTAPNALAEYHESLRGWWYLAEIWPKIVSVQTSGVWRKRFRLNLGRRRFIPPDSMVHSSVEQRLGDRSLGYKPPNLPRNRRVAPDDPHMSPSAGGMER